MYKDVKNIVWLIIKEINSILEGLKEYISTSLKNYFEINEYTKGNSDKIEKELIESINDCIEKQMSVWFGVELSRLRYNICLYNEFGDLLMGVWWENEINIKEYKNNKWSGVIE